MQRDRNTTARLHEAGWTVIEVWEHNDVSESVASIVHAVRSQHVA